VLALASADVSRYVNARGRRGRDYRHGHRSIRLGFGIEDRGLVRALEPDFTSSFVFLSHRQHSCLGHHRQYPAV
jgi:hypothetical protein